MAEFLTMEQAEDKFGSKGKANAGLTLGIIGTALAGLGGGLGGIFGGRSVEAPCGGPSAWEAWQKQCEENIALTRAIYDGRIVDLKEKFDMYKMLDDKISEVSNREAVVAAQLPLMFQLANVTAERYADDKVNKAECHQSHINFAFQRELDKKINGTLGLPWNDIITGIPTMPAVSMAVNCPNA